MSMRSHRTSISDVPVFWADSGRPGLTASLQFRAGYADETVPTSGWTHLLEHLALEGRDKGSLDVNGSVGPIVTTFDARGEVADVVRFLADVTRWLDDPELTRLPHHVDILKAERSQRRPSAAATAFVWRYGASGPGLTVLDELGLNRAEETSLRRLAHETFTKANAVLLLDGAPPDELELTLRQGLRRESPPPTPCDDRLPRHSAYVGPRGQLCMSGVVGRSPAATSFSRIAGRRLTELLRHQAGTSYSPWQHYEPIAAEQAIVLLGADVADESQLVRRLREVVDIVDELTERWVTEAELEDDVARTLRQYEDPLAPLAEAWSRGHALLVGSRELSIQDQIDGLRAVDRAQVMDVAKEFAESLLIGLPPAAVGSNGVVTWMPRPSYARREGTVFRSKNRPADTSDLLVTTQYVAHLRGQNGPGIGFQELVGAVMFPDGGRLLIDRKGYSLEIEPTMWRRGDALVEAVDAQLPERVRVPMPARKPDEIPQPAPARRRYRTLPSWWPRALWIAIVATVAVVSIALGQPRLAGTFVVVNVAARALAKARRPYDPGS